MVTQVVAAHAAAAMTADHQSLKGLGSGQITTS